MEDLADDRLDEIVNQYLAALESGRTPPSLHHLSEVERREALGVIRLLDAAWNAASLTIPALEDDPVAIELGLVTAPVVLNGSAVKAARNRQRLTIGNVSKRLAAEGYKASYLWLFNAEQGRSTPTHAHLAASLARILNVSLTEIQAATTSHESDSLVAFLHSPRYAEILGEWAERLGRTPESLRVRSSELLTAAPRRDRGDSDHDEWERMLVALLESGKL